MTAHSHSLCGLDLPCDKDECTPERQEKFRNTLKEYVQGECSDEEQKFLEMRFGFCANNISHTLEEIERELGVTHEELRAIEAKALEKIERIVKSWPVDRPDDHQ